MPPIETLSCPDCGTQVPDNFLACPACHRLLHAEELKRLAAEAQRCEAAQDLGGALGAWREAMGLLPPESRQHATIAARISALSRRAESEGGVRPSMTSAKPAAAKPGTNRGKGAMAAAVGIGALLFKFKFVLAFILTKAKLLILGLGKLSTFSTMFLSFGVYWAAWGWKFALGLVVSIYIHEMGHVAALRRFGIPASAPMFIPGLGAMIRLRQTYLSPREDSRIGLAGPIWGLAAAVAAYLAYLATQAPIFAAIAHVGAWINLFNLLPVWQLDGGRGFRSLTRGQRWIAVAALGAAWFFTAEGLLLIIAIFAVMRAAAGEAAAEPDQGVLAQYIFLVAALAALCVVPVPIPDPITGP